MKFKSHIEPWKGRQRDNFQRNHNKKRCWAQIEVPIEKINNNNNNFSNKIDISCVSSKLVSFTLYIILSPQTKKVVTVVTAHLLN